LLKLAESAPAAAAFASYAPEGEDAVRMIVDVARRHALPVVEDVESGFYLHMEVADRPGVLAQIAEILGIPYGTVGSRLHYALQRMRTTLGYDEDSGERRPDAGELVR